MGNNFTGFGMLSIFYCVCVWCVRLLINMTHTLNVQQNRNAKFNVMHRERERVERGEGENEEKNRQTSLFFSHIITSINEMSQAQLVIFYCHHYWWIAACWHCFCCCCQKKFDLPLVIKRKSIIASMIIFLMKLPTNFGYYYYMWGKIIIHT